MKNWVDWHQDYDDPASGLSARLACVRGHLGRALDDARAGEVSLVSLCAGQGHDVRAVLARHPRRADVRAVLVELDHRNAEVARETVAAAGLHQVQVREADASVPCAYADFLPAQILLLCGIFGNISDADIERTIRAAPALCDLGAVVIWTRHRREPDVTPRIREWFAAAGFEPIAFDPLATSQLSSVGVSRLTRPGEGKPPEGPLFSFLTS